MLAMFDVRLQSWTLQEHLQVEYRLTLCRQDFLPELYCVPRHRTQGDFERDNALFANARSLNDCRNGDRHVGAPAGL